MAEHWDEIYRSRRPEDLGWYEETPTTLSDVIDAAPDPGTAIIDVGAGASTLVDHLLDAGYRDVTLLDESAVALGIVRDRLGDRSHEVDIVVDDVLSFRPARRFGLWHDRAVFHFLTSESERRAYLETLDAALAPDGTVVLAVFAPSGPSMCAGLPVCRYDAHALVSEVGELLSLVGCRHSEPATGAGDRRPYTVCRFVRR